MQSCSPTFHLVLRKLTEPHRSFRFNQTLNVESYDMKSGRLTHNNPQIYSYTSEDAHDHRGVQRDLGAWFEEARSSCGTCFMRLELVACTHLILFPLCDTGFELEMLSYLADDSYLRLRLANGRRSRRFPCLGPRLVLQYALRTYGGSDMGVNLIPP